MPEHASLRESPNDKARAARTVGQTLGRLRSMLRAEEGAPFRNGRCKARVETGAVDANGSRLGDAAPRRPGDQNRRLRQILDIDPSGRVLAFALDEAVAGVLPKHDVVSSIVEDEVAEIGSDHQDG